MATMLKVRTTIEMGNLEAAVKIKKHYTVWQVKILVYQEIDIHPNRQALFVHGKTTELDDSKMIKTYATLFESPDPVLTVKDRRAAGIKKKKAGRQISSLFKSKKFKERVNPKLCFIAGRGAQKALVGSQTSFTIFAIEKDYSSCQPKDIRLFEVVAASSNQGEHIPLQFDSDEEGNVLVHWTPTVPGMYAINVRLYNEDIAFSPYIVQVEDHEGSGSKLRAFLEDDDWRREAITLLADWAHNEEYHKSIFNEIGVPAILKLVNAEPQEIVRPQMARVLDGLLGNDTGMRKVAEEGGNDLFGTLALLTITSNSLVILRFLTRAVASQAALLRELSKCPEAASSPLVEELYTRFSKQFFGNLGMILRECTDLQSIRNVTRATAELAGIERFRPILGAAEFFKNITKLVFGDEKEDLSSTKSLLNAITALHRSTDTTSLRYALHAIANFAEDKTFRETFFTEKHVTKLLGFLDIYTQDDLVSGAVKALSSLAKDAQFCLCIISHAKFESFLSAVGGTDSFPNWEVDTSLKILPPFAQKNEDQYRTTLISQCRGDEAFNHAAVKLLNTIFNHSPDAEIRAKILRKEMIQNVVHFMMSINLQLQAEACGLAAQLSIYEDGRDAVIEAGGINALCTALNTGNADAAAHVVQAFAQMPLEVKDILVNVIGDAGVDKLIKLLEVKELQRSVAILLASLAGDESCISRIVRKGGKQFMNQLIEVVRRGQVQVQSEISPDEVKCDKIVGEGISGVVWRGRWRDQEVAVKKFDEESIAFVDAEFRSEVALMSVLRHENIVHCMGSCTQPGNLFIVSELFTRGSLVTVVKDKSIDLPIQRVCQMSLDAAKGMRYLHRLGIIHRDLKPGNLLVNEKWQVKVADFGVSRMSDSQMTRGVGTPVYTAPEALASSNYSQKADVYSFAFVMWELLSREEPYSELSPFEAVRRACDEDYRPKIPENCVLEGVIESCWSPRPEDRPTFDDLVAALTEISSIVGGGASMDILDDKDEELDRYERAHRVLTQMGTLKADARAQSAAAAGRSGAPSKRASVNILNAPAASLRKDKVPADVMRERRTSQELERPRGVGTAAAAANMGTFKSSPAPDAVAAAAAEARRAVPPPARKAAAAQDKSPRAAAGSDSALLAATESRAEQRRASAGNIPQPKSEMAAETAPAGGDDEGVPPSQRRAAASAKVSDRTMRPGRKGDTAPRKKKPASGTASIRKLNKETLRSMIREQQLMKEEEERARREAAGAGGGARAEQTPSPEKKASPEPAPAKPPASSGGGGSDDETMVICSRCKKEMAESRAISALGTFWHSACFTCTTCECSLTGGWKRHEGKPYCSEHAPNVKKCARCLEPLIGSYINAMDKSWHQDCFTCSKCKKSMDSFVDVGGQPVCATCYGVN